MENYFHQEFVLFEDDTIQVELPLEVIEFSENYNVNSISSVWFGISNLPGQTYILQKSNEFWDGGLLNSYPYGPAPTSPNNYLAYANNLTAFQNANPTEGDYVVDTTTDGDGVGAIFALEINASNNITSFYLQPSNTPPGQPNMGLGYQPGDTITLPASEFIFDNPAVTSDLELYLDPTQYPAPFLPPNTGDIEIDAPEGASGPATVIVNFNQSDFESSSGPLVTGNDYYWEVVIGENRGYYTWNYKQTPQTVAAGFLHISASVFSVSGFRP
jgi:hypothetical protein